MNVSSLIPWLSDFYTVQFSGSSSYFLFLSLLLSFFWLCKEAKCMPPSCPEILNNTFLFAHKCGITCSVSCHLALSASQCLATGLLCLAAHLCPSYQFGCFFFNSLVVRLPYSSIFCQFWLFLIFKFVVVLLLVVRGGTVCLPMPPSWPEVDFADMLMNYIN